MNIEISVADQLKTMPLCRKSTFFGGIQNKLLIFCHSPSPMYEI